MNIGNEYHIPRVTWDDAEFPVAGSPAGSRGIPGRADDVAVQPPVSPALAKRLSFCNLFRVHSDDPPFAETTLNDLLAAGCVVFMDFFRCRQESIDLVVRQMAKHPGRIWGVLFGELDSDCNWPSHVANFATKQEAAAWFHEAVWRNEHQLTDLERHRDRAITGRAIRELIRTGTIGELKLPLMAHGAQPFAIQHYYEWGCSLTSVNPASEQKFAAAKAVSLAQSPNPHFSVTHLASPRILTRRWSRSNRRRWMGGSYSR